MVQCNLYVWTKLWCVWLPQQLTFTAFHSQLTATYCHVIHDETYFNSRSKSVKEYTQHPKTCTTTYCFVELSRKPYSVLKTNIILHQITRQNMDNKNWKHVKLLQVTTMNYIFSMESNVKYFAERKMWLVASCISRLLTTTIEDVKNCLPVYYKIYLIRKIYTNTLPCHGISLLHPCCSILSTAKHMNFWFIAGVTIHYHLY